MSLSLSLGNNGPLSLSSLKDLGSQLPSMLTLGQKLDAYLDQPLSSVPAELRSIEVQYTSGNQSWAPGPVSFTLCGGVCGKISILTSGDLLSYTDSFPTTVTLGAPPADNKQCAAKVNIAAPDAYLCLELDFTLSGGISGSYTSGIYGVSGDGSAKSAVTVAFYKHCTTAASSATTLKQAIVSAFEGFVLPLHAETLARLSPGDYLHYTFNGSLQLGFGATVGINKVLYAGQYKSDIPKIASALNVSASAKPEVQAGAKLAFSYDYTGAFEVLLWLSAPKAAHLHLYRSSTQDTTLGLDLGITASANASASMGVDPSQVETALSSRLPAIVQSTFKTKVLDPANAELGKYVGEMNSKMSSWLTRANSQKAALDLAIEATRDRFLLTDYSIDLSQAYQPAWKLMLGGRFLDAFSLPHSGVTLDTGSGLENVFTTTSSIKLNLFGALSATWSDTTLNNTSLLYAGNNSFHLITNQGRSLLTQINGGQQEIDIYFAAEADLSTSNAPISNLSINLHVTLKADRRPDFGAYIASIVGLLSHGQDGRLLTASVQQLAAKPGTSQLLHLIFSPATYGTKLQASTLVHGRPDNEFPDQQNFAAFTAACGLLFANQTPQNFTYGPTPLNYALWSRANILANDSQPPANAQPNRLQYGDPTNALVYLDSKGLDAQSQMIWNTLNVGAHFMNLCADLKDLAASTATTDLASWTQLVAQLQAILKNDVSVDFIPPTALALANLCGGAPATVSGPTPSLPAGTSIGITMTY